MPTIRLKVNSARIAYVALFTLGTVALIVSIINASSILALIGLGLIFWAIILTYIQTEEYTKRSVLSATTISLQSGLDQALQYLGMRATAVYLPPKYLSNPESKVFISQLETGPLPTPKQTQRLENQLITRTNQSILINPPGAELARLFEDTLGTSFTRTDLDYIKQNLPKLLIESLEIAQDVEVQGRTFQSIANQRADVQTEVLVRITSATYRDIAKQAQQLPSINKNLGCPLTSAIAIAIAKASGKRTIIGKQELSEDCKTVETTYLLLEEEQNEE